MKISTAHQQFAYILDNQRALEHPEEFLGQNWKDVLNFWIFIDTLTEEQWKSIRDAYYSLSYVELRAARLAAVEAARVAAWAATAGYAAGYSARAAACYATRELIGSHILKEQGKSLVFFPLFLNV